MKKILVARTDGIGDLLLTTPLFKALKESAGSPHVAVLASPYASAALLNSPYVDEVILYHKDSPAKNIESLKRSAFDCAIAAYARPEIAWLFCRAGIKERYGTSGRWYSPFLFNRRVKVSRKKSERHEADYNLMLAEAICGTVKAEKEYMFLTDEEKKLGREYTVKKGLAESFVIVHPGSKGSAWNVSENKYAEIIKALAYGRGKSVLVTGGPAEQEKLARIKNMAQCGVYMEEKLDFRVFAGVISAASCVISSSTGPMHMAAALGVRTLSFFPPDSVAAMAMRRWRPLGNRSEILKPSVTGKNAEESMESIKIEDVLKNFDLLCSDSV